MSVSRLAWVTTFLARHLFAVHRDVNLRPKTYSAALLSRNPNIHNRVDAVSTLRVILAFGGARHVTRKTPATKALHRACDIARKRHCGGQVPNKSPTSASPSDHGLRRRIPWCSASAARRPTWWLCTRRSAADGVSPTTRGPLTARDGEDMVAAFLFSGFPWRSVRDLPMPRAGHRGVYGKDREESFARCTSGPRLLRRARLPRLRPGRWHRHALLPPRQMGSLAPNASASSRPLTLSVPVDSLKNGECPEKRPLDTAARY